MMSTSSPVSLLLPVTFYGQQSKKRSLRIRRSLENQSKRLKDERIPDAYHSRLLGPSACWQIFYRQQEALDFVNSKAEDLRVFAFECRQPDKKSGQRQFLAASYPVLWHYYMQLDPDQRHHYEVIPEGCPCKLYFDLEFHKSANPCADGASMVETLIKYVCCWLKELFDVRCNREAVLELTASTETKFSRHLIFQLEESVFTDNITAGHFIRSIFALLEDHLHHRDSEDQKGNQDNSELPVEHRTWKENIPESSYINPSFDPGGVELPVDHAPREESTSESSNTNPSFNQGSNKLFVDHRTCRENSSESSPTNPSLILPSDSELTGPVHKEQCDTVQVDCDCTEQDGCSGDCVDGGGLSGCRSADRNLVRPVFCVKVQSSQNEETASCGSMGQKGVGCFRTGENTECCAVERSRHHCYKLELEDSVGFDAICDEKRTTCAKDTAAKEQLKEPCSEKESDQTLMNCLMEKTKVVIVSVGENMDMEESISSQVQVGESIAEKGETSGCEREMETKLTKLFEKVLQQFETDELRSLFVKDRDGRDTCFADLGVYTKNRNFRLYKSCKLGKMTAFTVAEQNTYSVGDICDDKTTDREIFLASLITNVSKSVRQLTFEYRPTGTQKPCRITKTSGTKEQAPGEHIEGSGKSPYPEVDDFITSQVSGLGQGGAIRRWTYFPAAEILSYDIVGYRFCYNVQRQHRSNNIKLVADLQRGVWYQKCYDPDCQSVNFKSEEFRLPCRTLPAYYFADDFENLTENDVDEEDTACLLALQDLEQRTMAEGVNGTSDLASSFSSPHVCQGRGEETIVEHGLNCC